MDLLQTHVGLRAALCWRCEREGCSCTRDWQPASLRGPPPLVIDPQLLHPSQRRWSCLMSLQRTSLFRGVLVTTSTQPIAVWQLPYCIVLYRSQWVYIICLSFGSRAGSSEGPRTGTGMTLYLKWDYDYSETHPDQPLARSSLVGLLMHMSALRVPSLRLGVRKGVCKLQFAIWTVIHRFC